MSTCSGSLGVTLGEAEFTDLDYADDAVLLAQEPGIWQAELKRFDNVATTMGLHTSWEKTKLQTSVSVLHLNQSPLMDIPWRSPISSSTWAALSTPLATPILTFFDESALHHR